MMHIAAIAIAVGVSVGVVSTPTFARTRDSNAGGISCPAVPPLGDRSASRDGSMGIQAFGIGANGVRSRVESEADVIIRHDGTDAALDAAFYAAACRAIASAYPGQPMRQLQELEKVRDRLRRQGQNAAKSGIADLPGDSSAISSANPPQSATRGTTSPRNAYPRQSGAGTGSAGAQGKGAVPDNRLPMSASSSAQAIRSPDSYCDGRPCASWSPSPSPQPPPVSPERNSIDYSVRTDCDSMVVTGGLVVAGCPSQVVRTCTTSPPVYLSPPPFMMGNMMFGGMPITISGGQTTCTTSGGF